MNEDLHNLDDLFKKALDSHGEMPSDSVWDNIDNSLDKKRVLFISRKYKKLKWIAASLFIFSTGLAMYTWQTKLKNKELAKTIGKVKSNKQQGDLKELRAEGKEAVLNHASKDPRAEDTLPLNQGTDTSTTNFNRTFGQSGRRSVTEDRKPTSLTADKAATDMAVREGETKTSEETIQQKEEQYVKNEQAPQENRTFGKPASSNMFDLNRKQKNTSPTNLNATIASAEGLSYKKIEAKTELLKPGFEIEVPNVLLQRALPTLQINNKVVEKAASKTARTKSTSTKGVVLTLFYSPEFVSTKVNNEPYPFREDDRHEMKKKEKIKNAYATGVLLDVKTGKNFTVETGFTFSSMTTQIGAKQIYARPDDRGNISFRFNCSAGYSYIPNKTGTNITVGDSIPAFSSKNTLQYIAVPVVVKYDITKGRFSLQPGVGIGLNILTKGKIETIVPGLSGPENAMNTIQGLKKTYMNGALSLGVRYHLNQTLALSFTPAAKFALTSINKDAPYQTDLNSIGLAAGLTIRL